MATKKTTSTKNTKNTKTTTTTTSSRPYSSPNYTTTTTTPKASTSSTSKNTSTSSANKSTTASTANTTTNAVKNTATTTTAPKSSTTTTGARPYSSPNASTANQGTTAVNKGSNYTSLPYSTPNANLYNTANTAPATPTPAQNLASGVSNLANNAAPYAAVLSMATGATNPAPDTSNITPSSDTSDGSLWDAVVKSQGIAGSAATQPTSNILGNTTASSLDVTRPYSNPNYEFGEEETSSHHGGGGGHAFGDSEADEAAAKLLFGMLAEGEAEPQTTVGKGSLGEAIREQAALDNLLNTLSSEGIPGYEAPYNSPNAGSAVNSYVGDTTKSGDTNYNLGGGSGSGSSGGGYGGGSGIGGQADVDALYELLNQRLGEYDENYNSLLASLMDAYNLNYSNLDDAYAAALANLGLNYNNTEALLNGQLANSRNDLEEQRRRALQEAYISRMMQEKNLENVLAGYGLSGGATESVLANMLTNYANNRNNVETKMSSLLNDLLLNYATNISNARQRYNEGIMAAEQNRVNARQNLANNLLSAQNNAANYRAQQRAGAEEDLFNALAKLTLNGYTY